MKCINILILVLIAVHLMAQTKEEPPHTGSGTALSIEFVPYSTVMYQQEFLQLDSLERVERRDLERKIYHKRKQRVKKSDRHLTLAFHNYTDMKTADFGRKVREQLEMLQDDMVVDEGTYRVLLADEEATPSKNYKVLKLKTKGGNHKPQRESWESWESFSNSKKDKGIVHVYVVNSLPKKLGHGYARPGWISRNGPDIVIRARDFGRGEAPFDQGKVMTHLLGNYLGLIPLSGWAECVDDGVADTPIHNSPLTICDSDTPYTSTCDYQIMLSDNFMSHTADACKSNFTTGQWKRMIHVLDLINQKNK